MNEDRLRTAIGLAARAGKLASGDTACQKAMRMHSAKLLLIDATASAGTQRRMIQLCQQYDVPYALVPAACMAAQAAGRDTSKLFAIQEANLAQMASEALSSVSGQTASGKE
nr:ribosomal L7Ae/L30e/S12e/Gadd45 family protein [Maliibacterium massiliense]